MKVLVSAFRCSESGVSEACVGFNWAREISRRNETSLITGDKKYIDIPGVDKFYIPIRRGRLRKSIKGFISAAKPDYFVYDFKSYCKHKNLVEQFDVYHHITPVAPRYSNLLCLKSKKFIIGPIGGTLQMPDKFNDLKKKEPFYFRLKKLDRIRFDLDPLLRKTYEKADIILIIGSYMLDILPERYHGKTRLMIDVGFCEDDYSFNRNNHEKGHIDILYVGKIVPYKGLGLLIKAIPIVNEIVNSRIRVNIVGKGDSYEEYCKRLVQILNIESFVKFYGRKNKKDVLEFYRQADIFCFPTLNEAGGTVLVEAMASGLPIISINRGGPVEIVGDGGFLIDPTNEDYVVHKIAEKISFLVNHPDQRRELGARAQKYAFANHTWNVKGLRLQGFYEELFSADFKDNR